MQGGQPFRFACLNIDWENGTLARSRVASFRDRIKVGFIGLSHLALARLGIARGPELSIGLEEQPLHLRFERVARQLQCVKPIRRGGG